MYSITIHRNKTIRLLKRISLRNQVVLKNLKYLIWIFSGRHAGLKQAVGKAIKCVAGEIRHPHPNICLTRRLKDTRIK